MILIKKVQLSGWRSGTFGLAKSNKAARASGFIFEILNSEIREGMRRAADSTVRVTVITSRNRTIRCCSLAAISASRRALIACMDKKTSKSRCTVQ